MYALLALHPAENFEAICEFAQSIDSDFKRSHLLYKLVALCAERTIEFDRAERIARSIPIPYWRFDALNKIASELLRRDREFQRITGRNREYHERALRLLSEIEQGLPLVAEDDRASVLWSAGLSLVGAGKLEWAEDLVSTSNYCPENTEVLLRIAAAHISRGQINRALQLAQKVGELATTGAGNLTNRAFDLEEVAELFYAHDEKDRSRQWLEQAAKFAHASQEANDIDGCKCLGAIAIAFAKQGLLDEAKRTANLISQPARREYALQKIKEQVATSIRNIY